MLLCLIVLVPLQGLAVKAVHACPLQHAIPQTLPVQGLHPGQGVSLASSAAPASADHSRSGQLCVSHGSIAWMAMAGSELRAPALPASRMQPAAVFRFSSFIPRQPRRPPLSRFA